MAIDIATEELLTLNVARSVLPFVHVEYHRHSTLESYQREIRAHVDALDIDFMDGFAFGPNEYVLSVGNFVDRAPYTHCYDWVTVYYETTRT